MQVSSERQLRLRCHRRNLVFIVCFFIEVFHIVICMIDDFEVVEGVGLFLYYTPSSVIGIPLFRNRVRRWASRLIKSFVLKKACVT